MVGGTGDWIGETSLAAGSSMDWNPDIGMLVVGIVLAALVIAMLRRWTRHRRSEEHLAAPAGSETSVVAQLRDALRKSRAALQGQFDLLFARGSIDDALFEDIEATLLAADVGMPTTQRFLDRLRAAWKAGEREPARLRILLREEMIAAVSVEVAAPEAVSVPYVILVVGVNGSGKTTTIGKLSAKLVSEGKRVMIAAGDTFRAAAIEQLQVWAQRAGADVVAHQEGADPAAVVFDALHAAKARGHDIVIIDTAGRLQTRKPLMDQLSKVRRVIEKVVVGAPHETLLVVDGTMGQNALSQGELFNQATPLTGVVVTKLDGTAKGGMVVTLAAELQLPVRWIGVGERVEDLRAFDPRAFVEALS